MRIKQLISAGILAYAFSANTANAFFVVFVPGAALDRISDAFTGAEGDYCVKLSVKVGDKFRLKDGSIAVVKSLSDGMSPRCRSTIMPIRAVLAPAMPEFSSKAGIELPEGWTPQKVSEQLRSRDIFFYASNKSLEAGLIMSAIPRAGIGDIDEFVKNRESSQAAKLTGTQASEIEQLNINGMPAYRFVVSGTTQTGKNMTYHATLIDSGSEIVYLNSWIYTVNYPDHRTELGKLAYDVIGLGPQEQASMPPESH